MDAVIDLIAEGHNPPSAELVAERAGVSIATLFRYFDSLDAMRHQTVARYFERYAHLFDIPHVGVGSLDERIMHFVNARVELHEVTALMARMARANADQDPACLGLVERSRATRRDQIRLHFDDELDPMTATKRADVVALIGAVTSYEAWDQIRNHDQRSAAQCRRAWVFALTQLLSD